MEKVKEFFLKLYRMRFKVNRKGTPVLNWSVLFSLVCLIAAPKLVLTGVVIALLLGYQFSFEEESAEFGAKEIEDKIRNVANSIRSGASQAAAAVKAEAEKAAAKTGTAGKEPAERKPAEKEAAPVQEAAMIRQEEPAADINEDVLADLERHADDFQSNPAATTFHSAYSAMADSVPTLQFPAGDEPENPAVRRSGAGA